ncbi:MAG: methyl-accepting chemotaxis protein, partial [Sphingobacteriaceae bacterium]
MDWFKPSAGTITELSIACLDFVFLVYLLTLKKKTQDCYLILLSYLTAFLAQLSGVINSSTIYPSFNAVFAGELFNILSMITILWCSYRFYKNTYPREALIVCALFTVLSSLSAFLYLKDYWLYLHISVFHVLFPGFVYSATTLLACINYLRKFKKFSNQHGDFLLIKEFLHPSTKVVAVFRSLALSLFLYSLIWFLAILEFLNVLNSTLFNYLSYLLGVSINTLVAFSYFNYAREQTSFETKLVGVTLLISLSVLALIPLTLFGLADTADVVRHIKAFVFIIPISTLLISFVLPLLFRLTVLKDLNRVVSGVQSVISGDLTASVDIEVNDEIGRLSHNFNNMTESLRQRTEQLNSMRETIAADFHDQTGNMLSAITRQASLLKVKLERTNEVQPVLESIIKNSNSLQASSKDFLWQLNHNSDDPTGLFDYLTSYGQMYYNQFDIAFSSAAEEFRQMQFDPSAALNITFILKEAMTNVVK